MSKKTYFISADIEGVTGVTHWDETEHGGQGYDRAAKQMTLEVAAACEAILEAGHDVVVRDGHDTARNILHEMLPRGVKLMRGWACDPGSMVAGINESYAGILYIGYHSPGGTDYSPLAHTMSYTKIRSLKINGRLASEFTVNRLYAAQFGVPSIFISGDAGICELAKEEVPEIVTVAVKECKGNSTFNLHPQDSCQLIKENVAKALQMSFDAPVLPDEFEVELALNQHQAITAAAANPHVTKLDNYTVSYKARTPREMNMIRESLTR